MVLIVTYSAYVRLVEGRTPDEVMAAGAVGELTGGALVGAGLVAAIAGSLWLVGAYVVTDVVLSIAVAGTLATDLAGGLVEEILFRAVLFRIGRELIGTRWALLLSALLFGLVHADTSITFAVACLGGLLFGCAYILTERVWMAAGIHIAWDFTQGGILGVGVSQASLVHGRIRGSIALTGGSAGIEGSLIALAIVGFAAVTFLTFALRRERIAGMIASLRLVTSSLPKMLLGWDLTVVTAITDSRAASALDLP
jgi:membrane protease YdiL (CAAX protease family)